MKTPKIPSLSVCMSTYNGESFLLEQLESIARELTQDDELIVIDDASSDNTLKILEDFVAGGSCRVHLERNPRNLGPAANFGRAAGMALNDVIVFADQDDIWLARRGVRIRTVFTDECVFLYHGNAIMVDEHLAPLGCQRWSDLTPELYATKVIVRLLSCFLQRSQAVGCMMAFRRRRVARVFFCLMAQAPMHDLFLLVSAGLTGGGVILDEEATMLYRRHSRTATVVDQASRGLLSLRAVSFRVKLLGVLAASQICAFAVRPMETVKEWRRSFFGRTVVMGTNTY